MTYDLGVDFGTSFTAAVAISGGSSRVVTLGKRSGAVPTAIYVRPDGSLVHGDEAYLLGGNDPLRVVPQLKRRLADPSPVVVEDRSFAPTQLVASYLRWVVDRASEQEGGPPAHLVFTHPANWRSLRLDTFRAALAAAGFDLDGDRVRLAPEPHAAALFQAAHHPVAVGELLGVYDLGGGTFDAAVLRRTDIGFELVAEPEGVDHLGGVDFDDTLYHLLKGRVGEPWVAAERRGGRAWAVALAGLRRECTAAKEALSSEDSVDIPIVLPGVNQTVTVTRREFSGLITPAVHETLGAFNRALRAAGVTVPELSGILLVGGSVALPAVRTAVAGLAGSVPVLDADPKHAVARGAALLAAGPAGAAAGPAGAPAAPVRTPPASPSATIPPLPAAAAAAAAVGGAGIGAGAAAGRPAAAAESGGPSASPPRTTTPPPSTTPPPAPMRNGRRRWAPIAVAVAVIALVAAAAVVLADRGGDDPTGETAAAADDGGADGGAGSAAPTSSTPASVTTTTAPARPASSQGMSPVFAGTYTLGLDPPGAENAAARTMPVGAFHLDVFEVTNGDYDRFVQSQGAPPASSWPSGKVPAGLDLPVRGVEWAWAQAYCISLSKRLPSEAEWEAAARGPAGFLFPWGATSAGVDLDTPGDRPVGSTAGNVSAFGIHDTVGSVWEWVDEPYEPVEGAMKVRRGGENGRVRNGAAMRQAVEQTNRSAVAETGFRCAADLVDPNVPPGEFSEEHPVPEAQAAPVTSERRTSGVGAVLVDDNFEDTSSGWPTQVDPLFKIGYHGPTWYHLEGTDRTTQVMALAGFSYNDASVETEVHVDKTGTATGRFRYGIVVRAEGVVEPPPGGKGNPRPQNFYAFTVDPRGGRWELLHADSLPLRTQASGDLPGDFTSFDSSDPDIMRVEMKGSALALYLNGAPVGSFDTKGFHLTGDVGFFVQTGDETLAHVHFGGLNIVAL